MKKALITTLLLALSIASYSQGYTSINERAEQYIKSTEDSIVFENPASVTIDKGDAELTINVKGVHNGNDYEITFKSERGSVNTVNESAMGIDVNKKQISFTHPIKFTLSKKVGIININIEGKEYTYKLRQEGGYKSTRAVSKETNNNWDFTVPFSKRSTKNSIYRPNARFSFNLLSDLEFGMGLVSATKQAPGMDIDFGNAGWEFILNNLFNWEYRPLRTTSLSLGFGVDWRNYRMTGNNRFVKDNNNLHIAPYPEGANINFSRVKVFSMTLELLLRQKITKRISIAAGPVVNFNTHASIKTRYSIGKGKEKEGFKETSSSIHQKPVTFDFKGVVSMDPLSFYFKYSPVNTLDTEFGPAFRSMSAGIMIGF